MATASGNDRAHAQYAPSAAHRWMVCPASVKATANIPSLSSRYAAEGTVAHHVLEEALNSGKDASHYIGDIVDVEIEGRDSSLIVTKEMADAVQVALDYLRPIMAESGDWSAEQRVSLEMLGASGCYGTSDFTAVIYSTNRILVVDYKHGAGVAVEAKSNPQTAIYGLGSLLKLGRGSGITHVQTVIVQPRIAHPLGVIRSHTYTVAEMMDFGVDVLDAIERCEADNPPYVPGEHCKWCGIEASCAARVKAISGDIVTVVTDMTDGMVLSHDEQERFLERIEALGIEDFVSSLRAAVHKHLEDGGVSERFKLVPKRGSRVWLKDESATVAALQPLLAKKKASRIDLYNSELKSPSQVESVVGKSAEARAVIAGLTASVSSGTNLVPIADSRQAAQITAEDEFDSLTD